MAMCLFTGSFLMVYHEMVKVFVYALCKKGKYHFSTSPWKVWRYLDPLGLLLSLVSYVPISKPYFFRVRDKKTNLWLGISGLFSLAFLVVVSVAVLKIHYGGAAGLEKMVFHHSWEILFPMFWECLATLGLGMLLANLCPISTFDMGHCLSGISAKLYLNIVKSDGVIKIIFMFILLVDLIHYSVVKLFYFVL
jgi:hypothetical protein